MRMFLFTCKYLSARSMWTSRLYITHGRKLRVHLRWRRTAAEASRFRRDHHASTLSPHALCQAAIPRTIVRAASLLPPFPSSPLLPPQKLEIWDTAGQETYLSITRTYYRNSHACLLVYDITRRESFDRVATWLEEARQNSNNPNLAVMVVGNKADLNSRCGKGGREGRGRGGAGLVGRAEKVGRPATVRVSFNAPSLSPVLSSHVRAARPPSHGVTRSVPPFLPLARRAVTTAEGEAFAAKNGVMFCEASAKDHSTVEKAFLDPANKIYEL